MNILPLRQCHWVANSYCQSRDREMSDTGIAIRNTFMTSTPLRTTLELPNTLAYSF
jgi:hypothetical protein